LSFIDAVELYGCSQSFPGDKKSLQSFLQKATYIFTNKKGLTAGKLSFKIEIKKLSHQKQEERLCVH
jgi:hypothetical protein